MLKPGDPQPPPERPIGDIVQELIEDGKSYARAELGVVKAVASAKSKALAVPLGLLGSAFLLAQAAVTVLAVATLAALSSRLGPVGAGLVAFLIFIAISGAIAWVAVRKLKGGL